MTELDWWNLHWLKQFLSLYTVISVDIILELVFDLRLWQTNRVEKICKCVPSLIQGYKLSATHKVYVSLKQYVECLQKQPSEELAIVINDKAINEACEVRTKGNKIW